MSHQHRRVERLGASVDPGGGLPTQVHLQAVTCVPVRQALVRLQQAHGGQHPGGDGRASPGGGHVEIDEVVVGEQVGTEVGEEAVDRPRPQPLTQNLPRVLEPLRYLCRPQRHGQILF